MVHVQPDKITLWWNYESFDGQWIVRNPRYGLRRYSTFGQARKELIDGWNLSMSSLDVP
jgi:hypothetical protein